MAAKTALVLAAGLAALAVGAGAQTPQNPPAPREPPSNTETGVSIDRFIGDANKAAARISHDVMFVRPILRAGDPQQPGDPGAVLVYNKEVALASLPGGNATPLIQMPEQLVLYVQSGTGRIDDGRQYWDLKPRTAVLIPPNQAHRLTATGDGALQMLMLSRNLEANVKPRDGILVRNVDALAMTERNVHWSNMAKYVFLGTDGLHHADRVFIVYMSPMTIAGPHAHTPGQEEIWIKTTDAPALMQLGSEIRRWPMNAGFLAPPNGKTVHAAINTSDELQAWLYIARLNPNAPPPSGPPRPVPAAIAEGVQKATVVGRPLPKTGR